MQRTRVLLPAKRSHELSIAPGQSAHARIRGLLAMRIAPSGARRHSATLHTRRWGSPETRLAGLRRDDEREPLPVETVQSTPGDPPRFAARRARFLRILLSRR